MTLQKQLLALPRSQAMKASGMLREITLDFFNDASKGKIEPTELNSINRAVSKVIKYAASKPEKEMDEIFKKIRRAKDKRKFFLEMAKEIRDSQKRKEAKP